MWLAIFLLALRLNSRTTTWAALETVSKQFSNTE